MARGAFDQAQTKIGFQSLHRSTEGGFRMPEHARGGAKAAMLHHLAKQLPIAPVHAGDCPSAGTVCPGIPDIRAGSGAIEDDTNDKEQCFTAQGEMS